jgi:hypothetical protein
MSEEQNLRNYISELIREVEQELEEATTTGNVDGYQTPHAFSRKKDKERRKKNATQLGYSLVDNDVDNITEAKQKRPVNRWLELKNDDTMHPHKKMAMGLKELKYQLAETEKFFNWYNKIKTMNELDSQKYWKRTQNHIYKIKERLINIAKTIQEIEK